MSITTTQPVTKSLRQIVQEFVHNSPTPLTSVEIKDGLSDHDWRKVGNELWWWIEEGGFIHLDGGDGPTLRFVAPHSAF